MTSKKRILLVDDDKDFKIIATKYLSNFNYEIMTASDGLNGIYKITKGEHKPDLVVMDINMDQIDGLEAYEMLQKNEEVKNIPIIFVSGFVEIEEISEVLRQHPDQIKYMKKPVSLNELLKLIRKVLGK